MPNNIVKELAKADAMIAEVNDTMTDSMTSMDRVHVTGKAFFEALAEWDGEELQNSIVCELIRAHMTPVSRAMIAAQVLLDSNVNHETMEPNRAGKQFAVDVAEEIGPDYAQWLYHFAKLVTKLA